jgi:hypothetical protein
MTTFGKILAIFNLLFSLGLGALVVLLHMAWVNNSVVATKWKVRAELAEASENAYKADNDVKDLKLKTQAVELNKMAAVRPADDVGVQVSKLRDEIGVKDQQVKSLAAKVDELQQSLITANKKNAEYDAIVKAHQVEAKQSLDDKLRLKTDLQDATKANTELRLAANTAREAKVAADIRATALEETNKQIMERSQDLIKENARLAKQLLAGGSAGTGATTVSLSAPNPPAFAVDLKVLGADDGLVEISGGSDAGLQKGHTLDVFRIAPKSQYLCMIRLITVDAHRSVGQVIGKPTMPVQRGDNVASKILGGN